MANFFDIRDIFIALYYPAIDLRVSAEVGLLKTLKTCALEIFADDA